MRQKQLAVQRHSLYMVWVDDIHGTDAKLTKSRFDGVLRGIDDQEHVELTGEFRRFEREVLLFESIDNIQN